MALKLIQGKQLNTNLTGSFTGSFRGDGSFLTGVVGEWDGTLDGNAQITGSLSQGNSNIAGPNSHAQGNYTKAIGVASHTEGITTYTGIQTAYSTISTSGVLNGVITLDEGYGDVRTKFTAGKHLYLYDEEFQGVYGRAVLLIRAVDFDGTNTTVELIDTSINTDQAYVVDIYYLTTYGSLEGDSTIPGTFAHAEGDSSIAVGIISHAEGSATLALGEGSHTEGIGTQAIGDSSHAEGAFTVALGIGSHAEGAFTIASGSSSHAEGRYTTSSGGWSHAEGVGTKAIGSYSHAEGEYTQAIGNSSHAEGSGSQAFGTASHAEGYLTLASGSYSHAEGYITVARGNYSHAEGIQTSARGIYSHAEGQGTFALGTGSHAEGNGTSATGNWSHAEGESSIAFAKSSHAEGLTTQALGNYSHAEGESTQAQGVFSHAEGSFTSASGDYSHAEGNITKATGDYSHAEGDFTQAVGNYSHTEGQEAVASGNYSHAEGSSTQAIGDRSHAEGTATFTGITSAFATEKTDGILNGLVTLDSGYGNISSYFTQNGYLYIHYYDEVTDTLEWASYLITNIDWDGTNTTIQLSDGSIDANQAFVGDITYLTNNGVFGGDSQIPGPSAHAEGDTTRAIGPYSHAEGQTTYALGIGSHAEGKSTYAVGNWSHAEGVGTRAIGNNSHAEGEYTQANGNSSHAVGLYTIAAGRRQHVQGMYNIPSGYEGAFIVGNGSAENNRSNLIFAAGNSVEITGSLTVTNNLTVLGSASIQYVSQSTLNIGTNLITVNTFNPTARFGGLAVIDSGSSPQVSASFLYDSLQDEFVFVHKGTAASAITSSVFLLGPETYNSLGNETYLTANRIPKGTGIEHLNDSNISDNGSIVSVNSNTQITGSLDVSGSARVNGVSQFISPLGSTLGTNLTTSAAGLFYQRGLSGVIAIGGYSNAGGEIQTGQNGGISVAGSLLLQRQGGNVAIGTATDTGRLTVRGSGATSATTTFLVQNSTPSTLFSILDNGNTGIGIATPSGSLHIVGATSSSLSSSLLIQNVNRSASLVVNDAGNVLVGTATDSGLGYKLDVNGASRISGTLRVPALVRDDASNPFNILGRSTPNGQDSVLFSLTNSFDLTYTNHSSIVAIKASTQSQGASLVSQLFISPTYNLNASTTSASIMRGLYYNPTITTLRSATHRAIETTSGDILFQSGSTPLLFVSESGRVGIGTSTFVGSIRLAVNGQIGGPTYSSTYLDVSTDAAQLRGNSGIGFYAASNDHIFYGASSVERVRITNAGNVIITGSLVVSGSGGQGSIDTINRTLSVSGRTSIDWKTRILNNTSGVTTLDWDQNLLWDNAASSSVDWYGRILYDSAEQPSIEYSDRRLKNSTNNTTLDWESGTLIGTASFAQTASYVNPLNQNVQITGSLSISGSLVVNNVDIQSTIVAMTIALG